MDDDIVLV